VMNIPNFPLIMVISYLTLLDSDWTNWIDRRLQVSSTSDQSANNPSNRPIKPTQSGCLGILMAIPRGAVQGAYRGLLACLLGGVMVVVIWGNLLNNDRLAIRLNVHAMPGVVESNLRATGLWQSWALFAPDPLSYEGWFGLNGIFANGETYDVRSSLRRPHWYSGPLARWGKLEENLMSRDKDDPLFDAWAVYTCNQFRSQGMVGLQIVLYSRLTTPPGQPFLPYRTSVIKGGDCR